jgi:hypothetical protein
VLVEIDEPKHPVIHEEHVDPGAQTASIALEGAIPPGNPGHAPRTANFRFTEPVEHVDPSIGLRKKLGSRP